MKQELGNLMAEDPHQETINLLTYRLNAVTVERDRYKQQRDRMAEAIRKHKFCDVVLYEALQSLKQPTQ